MSPTLPIPVVTGEVLDPPHAPPALTVPAQADSDHLDRGAPIHLVQQTLGHASVATTGRHLHARPTDSSARYLGV
jgi:integrase